MKTNLNITSEISVVIEVKPARYAQYIASLELGEMKSFTFDVVDFNGNRNELMKMGNDISSNKGHWYSHCNGYAKDCMVNYKNEITINTYKHYNLTREDRVKLMQK